MGANRSGVKAKERRRRRRRNEIGKMRAAARKATGSAKKSSAKGKSKEARK